MALFLLILNVFAATVSSVSTPQASANGDQGSLFALASQDAPDDALVIETIGSGPSTNTTFLLPDANISGSVHDMPFDYPGLDSIAASNAEIQCKGEPFGFNLSRTSCNDAINGWPTGSTVISMGQRGHGNFQAKLPARRSSSEYILFYPI